MYFKLGVKEKLEDFFDFESELNLFKRELQSDETRMIVIKGIRRTGKSSLLRVALNTAKIPYLLVDMRMLGPFTPDKLYDLLAQGLSRMIRKHKRLRSILKRIKGVNISGFSIILEERNEKTIMDVISGVESAIGRFVLVFDEAQDLRMVRGFDRLLAHIYDYRPRIKIILTGSEVGVLDGFLGAGNPRAALFGRAYVEITMKRLDGETSIRFLREGFRQAKTSVPLSEIEDAVNSLDGIIGWLVTYGYKRLRMKHSEALRSVIAEGSSIVRDELENFLVKRQVARSRYLTILKLLELPMRWSEIKRGVQAKLGRVPDNMLSNYLKQLVGYGFVEVIDGRYHLADPLISEAVREMH